MFSSLINKRFIMFALLLTIIGGACSKPDPTPVSTTPTHTLTATIIPTITPTPTPFTTPTPAPLKPSAIFSQISPSIAFIETPLSQGSGILLDGGYILTNSHVLWPYEKARITFADGSEFEDVPLVDWDRLGDLAVLGPIETEIVPLSLHDGEDLIIGSNVYLIGYPGEVEEEPVPTITRGLISRIREWEAIDMTYFQTDAAVGSGQSGGALVSELGEVIGISGFSFSDADFALAASAIDVLPRVEAIIAGEDVDQLGDRRLDMDGLARNSVVMSFSSQWEERTFIIDAAINEEIEIELSGENAVAQIMDSYGQVLMTKEGASSRSSEKIYSPGPHFVIVRSQGDGSSQIRISSNQSLIRTRDPDDEGTLTTDRTYYGNSDNPSDLDYFWIMLKEGEIVNVSVSSIMIDPFVVIGPMGSSGEQLVTDDDSGGGVFGLDAEITYQASYTGLHSILVVDASYSGGYTGGYVLTVREPYEGAPTPSAPPPTATPIVSEFGEMSVYESESYPFSIQYPADWDTMWVPSSVFSAVCNQSQTTICFANQDGVLLIITEEDLGVLGRNVSLEEYAELILEVLPDTIKEENILRESFVTKQGRDAETLTFSFDLPELPELDGTVAKRLVFLFDNVGFNATFLMTDEDYEEMLPMIEYVFESLRVE